MGFPTLTANEGNLVVIYTTKAGGRKSIHGAYLIKEGERNAWVPAAWTAQGYFWGPEKPSGLDITKALSEKTIQQEKDKSEQQAAKEV